MIKDIILPVGIIGTMFYFGNKFFFRKDKTDKTDDTVRDAEKDVVKKNLTHKTSWYSQASDGIQANLLVTWRSSLPFGSRGYKAIHAVLLKLSQLKNNDDWLMLVAKYGKRSGISNSVVYKKSLPRWLIYFLDDKTYYFKQKGKERQIPALDAARSILKKRGIRF